MTGAKMKPIQNVMEREHSADQDKEGEMDVL
jgi:hypothetical protein